MRIVAGRAEIEENDGLARSWGLGGSSGASRDSWSDDGKRSMALAIGDWSFSSVSQYEWL